MFRLQSLQSEQRLQVVVVGIDDAGVNLAASRMMARAVEQEGSVPVTALVAFPHVSFTPFYILYEPFAGLT